MELALLKKASPQPREDRGKAWFCAIGTKLCWPERFFVMARVRSEAQWPQGETPPRGTLFAAAWHPLGWRRPSHCEDDAELCLAAHHARERFTRLF